MDNNQMLFKLLENEIEYFNYKNFYLIENIEDINMQNKEDRNTLLHICAEYNNTTFAKLLLDLGAKPNIKNKYGKTPLQIAAQQCHKNIFYLLFMRKDIDKYQLTDDNEDILHLIYNNEYVGYLDRIVYRNRELNDLSLKDNYNHTPLDLMVSNSKYKRFVINNILDIREKHIYYFYKKDDKYCEQIQKKVLEKMILKDYLLGRAVVYCSYDAIEHLIDLAKAYRLNMQQVKMSVQNYITKYRNENINIYINKSSYKFFELCLSNK